MFFCKSSDFEILCRNIQGDPRGRPPEYVYAVQEYRYHDAYIRGSEDCLSYEYVYAVLSGDKAPLRSMVFCVRSRSYSFLGNLQVTLQSALHRTPMKLKKPANACTYRLLTQALLGYQH
jgi:uncharacterized membrane protein